MGIYTKMMPLYLRSSNSLSTHHNFQLLSILFFCNSSGYSRFPVFQLNIFHDRDTSAPPVFVSRFKYKKGTAVSFLYLGILCTAAWADVAEACPGMEYV